MSEVKIYPQTVVWEITFACNMRCLHCGTSAGTLRPEELSTEEALNLIDELADLECEVITLSGGEPLLRKDWRDLAQRVVDRNMKLCLITNGYAVTDDIVKDFKRIGTRMVGVSFDGTEKTHNHIRQNDQSYERALNAMKLMAKHDIRFEAVTQVSNLNLNELDDIRRELINVGCRIWRVQMTTCTGRMERDLVLDLENYPKLIDKLLEFNRDESQISVDVGENIGYYGCKGQELWPDVYLGCYAGVRVAGIESDGKVKGCLSMQEQFVEGNIRDSSFTEIWNNPDNFLYNRKFTRETASGECRECHYLPLCRGGCTTTSISATGERANNPYCIYQIERQQGIERPPDNEDIAKILARFQA